MKYSERYEKELLELIDQKEFELIMTPIWKFKTRWRLKKEIRAGERLLKTKFK